MCILLLNGANAQLILQFGGTNKHPTELKLNCKLTKHMTNSINFKRKLRLMSPKSTILLVYSRIVNSLLSCIDVNKITNKALSKTKVCSFIYV